MKTTVKLGLSKAITVQPEGAGLRIDLCLFGQPAHTEHLTADQVGALMFGMEQALEVQASRAAAAAKVAA